MSVSLALGPPRALLRPEAHLVQVVKNHGAAHGHEVGVLVDALAFFG